MMKRRDFLKLSAAMPVFLAPPVVVSLTGRALAARGRWDRTLILLEFNGGNDGINTIVPYADPTYYEIRPRIAVPRDKVIQIDEKLGFNPNLEPLLPLWKAGDMAVTLGVGYPDPNLSHFRGIDIWDTASDSDVILEEGWVSRLFHESRPSSDFATEGVVLGRNSVGPLLGGKARILSLNRKPDKFIKQAGRMTPGPMIRSSGALAHLIKQRQDLRTAADHIIARQIENVDAGAAFPDTQLGDQFRLVARFLAAGVKVPFVKLSLGKYDTHVEQEPLHGQLLAEVAGAIATFADVMKAKGLWHKVLVMSYSEFGRRPEENNSLGTDHGTSAPHFFFGGKVKGGLYGEQPPLDDMEDKNLKYSIHFRSLYATAAREWWGLDAPFIKEKPLGIIS